MQQQFQEMLCHAINAFLYSEFLFMSIYFSSFFLLFAQLLAMILCCQKMTCRRKLSGVHRVYFGNKRDSLMECIFHQKDNDKECYLSYLQNVQSQFIPLCVLKRTKVEAIWCPTPTYHKITSINIYTTVGNVKCTFDLVIVSITTKPYILHKILKQ